MRRNSFLSPGWRFIRKVAFSFFQAGLLGGLFGLAVYFRFPDNLGEGEREGLPLLRQIQSALERVELWTYDRRLQVLGATYRGIKSVAWVSVDQESLLNARSDPRPMMAQFPWPRALIGKAISELGFEGSSLVILESTMSDESPRACCASDSDDQAFKSSLELRPGSTVLPFEDDSTSGALLSELFQPLLLYAGQYPSLLKAASGLHEFLIERRPVYLVPEGTRLGGWIAIKSEEEGRSLAKTWSKGPAFRVRDFTASDRQHRFTPTDLLVFHSEVTVSGLSELNLPKIQLLIPPTVSLIGSESVYGQSNINADFDGIVRSIVHLAVYNASGKNHIVPSTALTAAMRIAKSNQLTYRNGRLYVGARYSFPMDSSGRSLLRWQSGEAAPQLQGSFQDPISAWKILNNGFNREEGIPPHQELSLVRIPTMLARTGWNRERGFVTSIGKSVAPGAIVGQGLADILESEGIVRVPVRSDLAATFILALLGAFLALSFGQSDRTFRKTIGYGIGMLVIGGGYAAVATYLIVYKHQWVVVAAPLAAMMGTFFFTVLYAARLEQQLRDVIGAAFGKYVTPELTERLLGDLSLIEPQRRQVSLCFIEVGNLSDLTDKLKPVDVVELLSDWGNEATVGIRNQRGHVDKHVGPGMMAFWGAPIYLERHAWSACESALLILRAVNQKRPGWRTKYQAEVVTRIGINSGEMIVGDLGNAFHANYTILGPEVGLAARLRSLNKMFGTEILVGEKTFQLASAQFVFREIPTESKRLNWAEGKVYELVARLGELNEQQLLGLQLYHEAVWTMREGRTAEARLLLTRCAREFGDRVAALQLTESETT